MATPKNTRAEVRDRIVELRRVPASELRANPKNWRTHPKAQQNALSAILADVGYADALLARETPDGLELIDGHLRAETTPDAIVPVLILDVTQAEADKILLTHDPVAAMAETGKEALAALLESVAFSDAAIIGMLDGLARSARLPGYVAVGNTDPDAVPPVPDEPVTQRGDLWVMGDHRLLCGDSTNAEDVARLMAGEQADIMWTDPPYGVSYVGKTKDALTISNDGGEGLQSLLDATWAAVAPALAGGAPFYIARPAGVLSVAFGVSIIAAGWQLHEELQWVKDSMVLGHSDYHLKHETIMYGWLPGAGRSGRGKHQGSRWYGSNSETSVFEIPRPKASPDHPTGKPVELVERHLANSSRPADAVLEPFSGSGTTLIACERMGRRCYAMEIEPRYVDVAVRRWEAYTGRTAERVSP